jgi:hypothetical protein
MPSLVLTHSGNKVNIKTAGIGGWEVQFDKSTGLLDFWQVSIRLPYIRYPMINFCLLG